MFQAVQERSALPGQKEGVLKRILLAVTEMTDTNLLSPNDKKIWHWYDMILKPTNNHSKKQRCFSFLSLVQKELY